MVMMTMMMDCLPWESRQHQRCVYVCVCPYLCLDPCGHGEGGHGVEHVTHHRRKLDVLHAGSTTGRQAGHEEAGHEGGEEGGLGLGGGWVVGGTWLLAESR